MDIASNPFTALTVTAGNEFTDEGFRAGLDDPAKDSLEVNQTSDSRVGAWG